MTQSFRPTEGGFSEPRAPLSLDFIVVEECVVTLDPTALESKNNALFLKIRECEHKEVGLYFSGFSRQEYWSGLPFPSLGDLPNPGIKPTSPALAGKFLTTEPPGKPMSGH